MLRSRAALAVGILVVLAAFAYGVEGRASATVAGQRVDCGSAIPGSWLLSGTDSAPIAEPVTTEERAVAAACDTVVQRARIGVLSTMAAGALLALVGWTTMRESSAPRRAGRPEVRSA